MIVHLDKAIRITSTNTRKYVKKDINLRADFCNRIRRFPSDMGSRRCNDVIVPMLEEYNKAFACLRIKFHPTAEMSLVLEFFEIGYRMTAINA